MTDQEPMYSCHNEYCAQEVSFHADMLRETPNGDLVCNDCWDAERSEDDVDWADLDLFVSHKIRLANAEADCAALRARLGKINSYNDNPAHFDPYIQELTSKEAITALSTTAGQSLLDERSEQAAQIAAALNILTYPSHSKTGPFPPLSASDEDEKKYLDNLIDEAIAALSGSRYAKTLLDERDRLRTDDFPKTITFNAYFIVGTKNEARLIDTDPAEMLRDGERAFGPYRIKISTPDDIALTLRMRAATIQGEVIDG